MAVENLGLGAFRRALNMRADGSFATGIEKTKGNLYVDGNGALKSANRHVNTVRTSPAANAHARSQLLSALESASSGVKSGAQLEFLNRVRAQLGLAGNHELSVHPLSRRDVKQIITEFDAIVRNEQKTRAAFKDVVNKLDGMPEDWVVTATADGKVDFAPPEAGAGRNADLNRRLAKLLLEVLHLSDSHEDVAKKAAELLGLTKNDARPVPPVTVGTIRNLKVFAAHAKDYHDAYVSFVQSGKPDAAERAMRHVEQQVQDDVRREAEAREAQQAAQQRGAKAKAILTKQAHDKGLVGIASTHRTNANGMLESAIKTIMLEGKREPQLDARDMDRYEAFLKEREGDSIGALYDLMRAKGVTDDCLKARYDYPNVSKEAQPKNRKEELDPEKGFQSKAMKVWQIENNIDDGILKINALEKTPKPKPAKWAAEAAGLLRDCEVNRNLYRMLKQQIAAPIPEDVPQPPPAPDDNIVNDDNNIINENW